MQPGCGGRRRDRSLGTVFPHPVFRRSFIPARRVSGGKIVLMFRKIFDDSKVGLRTKIGGMIGLLIAMNIAAWLWAFIAFQDYPVLLGTALLAYSFGLRHAVDPDHIAAIDNVTRKLMQEGKRPVSVGFFFSFGHSSVVLLLSIGLATTTSVLQSQFSGFREIGGVIGTSISAFFLFAIAGANILVLCGVWRSFRAAKRGEPIIEEDLEVLLSRLGFMSRILQRFFRLIARSWHMYPLGFLFGLGFETATEVAVLGLSAASANDGMPVWSILVFPALFSAGMVLVDTLDGILMLGAYGWAFVKPIRKLYYNLTITFVSVLAALLVGGLETLGLLVDQFDLDGPFWDSVTALNANFGLLGYGIIALFAVGWLFSLILYRVNGYDKIEAKI